MAHDCAIRKRHHYIGLAHLAVAECCCDSQAVTLTDPGDMPVAPCPPQCDPQWCEDVYKEFNALWRSCTGDPCRTLVHAYYLIALAACPT